MKWGMYYTHHGTFNEGGGGCPELVDGSNANTCGDFISDTPADPNMFFWNVNHNTCEFEPELFEVGQFYDEIPPLDENDQAYQPDSGNLMSYTYPTCMDDFTLGQKKRMKNALWYLNPLNSTLLEDYTYIRPQLNSDFYVCEDSFYEVYSSLDPSLLCPVSSDNVEIEIFSTNSNSITLKVTNLSPENIEGERGFFSILNCSTDATVALATQTIWVGKPKTIAESNLTGSETASSNSGVGHVLDNRIDGVVNYGWELPIPNEVVWGGEQSDAEVWQHLGYDKYFRFSSAVAGNQTGLVRPYGINPCGEGDSGSLNEICVENSDDPEGDTSCDVLDPLPILYYPNPANSLLEIDLSLQEYKIYTVVIYDENQTVKYTDQSTNIIKTVNVMNLINGSYYLHIYDDNNEVILSRILVINH